MARIDDRITEVKADLTEYRRLLEEGRQKNARTAAIPMGGSVTRYSLEELEDLISGKNLELDRLYARKRDIDLPVSRSVSVRKTGYGS